MNAILNYEITETVDEGTHTIVYRGHSIQNHRQVLVKVLKAERPSLADLARLKHEYEITKDLSFDGVIKPYGMENYLNGLAIILEDFAGETLKTLIASTRIELLEFLRIAIRLAEIMADLQRSNIIHRDIKPQSIFVNNNTGQVKITNFGIASRLSQENQKIINPDKLEGTLAYMSPEQTGRMNRTIDYRTDFYSLGVTFYEMLTDQLPFQSTDPMELVHSHIAKRPVPPHRLNQEVPQCVSEIILKLLSKTAEERYQSAYGIKSDLELCLVGLETRGRVDGFAPGVRDVSDRLRIPQKFYGRDRELAILISTFDRISQGKSELMLVSGYPGVGKSALVNEIHTSIVKKKGYFISGKFDQLKRNVPYSGIAQAFQELIKQILTEDEKKVESWKEQLISVLEPNVQAIIDVIPELELIVGKQPDIQQLGAAEAQNRFNITFQKFLDVFATIEHPLVIFLDDLQWADAASLKLIEFLMTDPQSQHLLMIGAYRDIEVSAAHPLMLTIEKIRADGLPVSHIELEALNVDHVTQFLGDALHREMEMVKPIAEVIFDKTNGNPFFMIEFLKAAYQNEILFFDGEQGHWEWELDKVRGMEATSNVIELMAAKIRKCSRQTQDVLIEAACIGSRFDLNTLAIIRQEQPAETAAKLWEALQEGLVLPIGGNYKYLDPEYQESSEIQYRFAHDRVRQAAYSLISEDDKTKTHLIIGRLLLDNTSEDVLEDNIFGIISHLNIAMDLLLDQDKRIELARLNLLAGSRAKSSNAYETALMHFRVGMELLPADSWKVLADLTFSLHIGRMECEYLSGDFAVARGFFDTIMENAGTNLEKAEACNLATTLYINLSQYKEAVEVGLEGLKLVGMNLSETTSRTAIMLEILKARKKLVRKKVEALINLPDMTDPTKKVALDLLMNIFPAAYFINQNLFALVVLKGVNLSLSYGNTDVSALAYSFYAILIGSGMGKYRLGDEFGHLALKLSERSNNLSLKGRVNWAFGTGINPWRSPFIKTIDYCREGLKYSLESGDLVYAGYAIDSIVEGMFAMGFPLQEVYSETQKYLEFAKRIKVQHAIDVINVVRTMYRKLKSSTDDQLIIGDGEAHVDEEEPKEEQLKVSYYLYRCQLSYLFGNYTDATEMAHKVLKNLDIIFGTYALPEFISYYSLILTAVHTTMPRKMQRQNWKMLKKNQGKMKKWAENCPENLLHRYLLVAAEMASISGDDQKAIELYDRAIDLAHQNEFIHHEGIAHELAAKFYLARGKDKIARTYMVEAHYNYLMWGATAKSQALEETYPHLLSYASAINESQDVTTTISSSSRLDLDTVMKASQAISGEIVLERLLEKLMRIAIENAGAQKGFLILEKEGTYVIEATGTVDSDEVTVLQSIPVETSTDLSSAMVYYVARTREEVVLNDAANEEMFATDSYIVNTQPKSVLCIPFINQGKLTGILYLENNLTTDAFTPDRLEILNLLASQAAISIENARLYNNLEEINSELDERVKQRTAELEKAHATLRTQHEEAMHELEDARKMQMSLMPETAPSIEGFEIAGSSKPTREVGGDFFDYIMVADGKTCLAVADVSGKGLKGAMNAILVDGMLHEVAKTESSCGRILSVLNSDLHPRMEKQMFAALILATLDQELRTIKCANAAQPHPIIKRGGDVSSFGDSGELPLAMVRNLAYTDRELELQGGDIVVFYTDGIIEAENKAEEIYGIERLEQTIANMAPTLSAMEIVETIMQDVNNFAGSVGQYDDMTIVAVKKR